MQRNDAAALIAAGNTAVKNPAQIWGTPEIQDDLKTWINWGVDLSENLELYGHGNYVSKTAIGGFYYRNPNTRSGVFSADNGQTLLIGDLTPGTTPCPTVAITNNVPDPAALASVSSDPNCFSFQEMFPGGFTPQFGGDLTDYAAVVGLRGTAGERLNWDVSAGYGNNRVDFFISNTVNASFGPDTPTTFDPGSYIQEELNINFDVSYELSEAVTLSGGAEYREETFEIEAGQVESWDFGPLADQGFSAASNGFPGFADVIAGSWTRANHALYADVGWRVTDPWQVDLAVRWEDFEDFGTTTNGKVATNYRFNDAFAVRGSWSTGFRAPTPGQSNASNVTTQFDTALRGTGESGHDSTDQPGSGVARRRGARSRRVAELQRRRDPRDRRVQPDGGLLHHRSRRSPRGVAGLHAHSGGSRGAGGFRRDQCGESAELPLLHQRLRYRDQGHRHRRHLRCGSVRRAIEPEPRVQQQSDGSHSPTIPTTLNASRIRQLEEGLPETRWSLTGTQTWGPLRALARVSQYDGWYDNEDGVAYDGGNYIFDAEIAYTVRDAMTFVLGAQNLFDEYPEENPGAAAGVGNRYSQYTPFGFNGGLWYGRFVYSFN